MLNPYLTTKEAATVLNVADDTVIAMVDDGTIAARYVYRIGKRREARIHPAALDPLLHPEDAQPHPQTHTLLTHLDRLTATVEADLAELRRVRTLIAEGAR